MCLLPGLRREKRTDGRSGGEFETPLSRPESSTGSSTVDGGNAVGESNEGEVGKQFPGLEVPPKRSDGRSRHPKVTDHCSRVGGQVSGRYSGRTRIISLIGCPVKTSSDRSCLPPDTWPTIRPPNDPGVESMVCGEFWSLPTSPP